MSKNSRKDILSERIDYTFISLLSNKISVVIIGGGRAGFIKCKSFAEKGCSVTVVSKEFNPSFNDLRNAYNVELIKDFYKKSYIEHMHLVVIAVDDKVDNVKIKEDCEKSCKLYLDCSNFKDGLFITPVQRQNKNLSFSIHTKEGNPKASILLADCIYNKLNDYTEFTEYIGGLREKVKKLDHKNEFMEFVSTEDFMFFYSKGVHESVLNMFYGGEDFEFKNCYKKE
ncbi:NAD(P)-dependent oxidoreductase [Clostridium sp.]|uniref:NAD(P)-dependent oxidoreductase n=1 Tax=Clostridium sp. TaxID=1506 RepID=UPI001A553705|nr:NAD(P)-dependent oxidoreductase [Clostridium sp.]MBK5242315.1 NAD(P)-dependent oxidoreductase [Clostridium sp.]